MNWRDWTLAACGLFMVAFVLWTMTPNAQAIFQHLANCTGPECVAD